MAGISAVIIVISIFLMVLVVADDMSSSSLSSSSSSVIRLPSKVTAEGKNVCAGAVASSWCPVKCFRTDPVCGVDGVTYWCGCAEAACAGVKVGKMGFCEVGSGGSAPLSAQAFLLLHIVWLIVLAFSVFFGLF
ncbi:hypothetical protein MtrunA17_Chr3g0128281 [Medicago truncatula]|uniref:Kazal-type serine protease inhibitor n=2 Tax=Medicago truncatula TaxID=3880 RepID=G7J9N7_MEDTR|nr:uncharacterized protein LOC11440454 [Medicago truncatula]AES72679.1 Kazal-type serine protease inhibitor [Medicago truncatula]RHN69761.1 hypothetical protein MtrunA17_Chr3g0128281 [Medicago truncatula]